MRQNQYVFDVENGLIGTTRRACNEDPHMIKSELDYLDAGKGFGLLSAKPKSV